MPLSKKLFLAAAGALFIQFVPGLNILTLLLGGPWWAGILFSLAMLAVAYEALTTRLPLWSLALPALWFGGHAAASALDHQALAALRAEFHAKNAAVRMPIDPSKHALVMPEGSGGYIVQNYRVPVVYAPSNTRQGFAHRSTRLVAMEICRPLWNAAEARKAGISTLGFHDESPSGKSVFEQRFCKLSAPEDPSDVAFHIERKQRQTTLNRLPVELTETLIRGPDGRTARLAGGYAAPLSWFPLPAIGCWNKCELVLSRHNHTPILDVGSRFRSDEIVLAQALGLERIDPARRVGADRTVINSLAAWTATEEPVQTAASRRRRSHQ